ncbi:hypothetical protein [Actinocorallia sp. A-T 12471]|uniref:hypothetical protein n=1 Tax=Actinocorallia sp. A-T 12471 TaxID=3089813 RepID=UPI0029CCA9BF|nr:hypothetical protein [Actinocorallia sp. A-T 12471]MDX6743388.1 hypothetical protein [Actinocorallia sp. A-T 12471]
MERVPLGVKNKIGLGLGAFLGFGDAIGVFTVPDDAGDQAPPQGILITCAVLGVVTLVAVVHAWRTGSRLSIRVMAASRVLSALTALPAFFVSGVPAVLVVIAATGILLTVVTVVLALSRPPLPA